MSACSATSRRSAFGAKAAAVYGEPDAAAFRRSAAASNMPSTPNVTLHEGSATAMPFADGTFDLIVSNLGVNNFDDRAGSIRECRRVAKAGATVALTTNLQGHMAEFHAIFEEVLNGAADSEARSRLRVHVGHRATVAGVRALLTHGGFAVTRVVERTARMRFATGAALLNHHFIKLGFLGAWKNVVSGRESEIFPLLQRRLNEAAAERGELSLTIPMAYVEAVAV